LSLTQVILGALPTDEYAVYNSQYALSECENQPTSIPTLRPTPSPTPTP
jgi:hypothetical protein